MFSCFQSPPCVFLFTSFTSFTSPLIDSIIFIYSIILYIYRAVNERDVLMNEVNERFREKDVFSHGLHFRGEKGFRRGGIFGRREIHFLPGPGVREWGRFRPSPPVKRKGPPEIRGPFEGFPPFQSRGGLQLKRGRSDGGLIS